MTKSIPLKFAVQIRIFCNNEELPNVEECYEETVFETTNKSEAYQYFEDLKLKTHEIQKQIRQGHYDFYHRCKPFFSSQNSKVYPKRSRNSRLDLDAEKVY